MNWKFLTVLICLLFVFSGCTEPEDQNQLTIEEKVIELAETETIEGEIFSAYKENLAKAEQCNAESFMKKMKESYEENRASDPSGWEIDFDNITEEQMVLLEKQIRELDACDYDIERKVIYPEDSKEKKYKVSYSTVIEGQCDYPSPWPLAKNEAAVIQVDLENKSAKTIKGNLTSEYMSKEKIRAFYKPHINLEECMKARLMGVTNPILPSFNQ